MIIDYRSDTVTKPTPGMMEAMMTAKVGDDVFGEDPSINELENMGAAMFGMEAAIFCPSGTMTNQIAINCHRHDWKCFPMKLNWYVPGVHHPAV